MGRAITRRPWLLNCLQLLSAVSIFLAMQYGWRQNTMTENAQEIRILAEDLHGRIATFVGHMNKVGRQLASSVDNYNRAVGSLDQKVLPGARKFVELGVKSKKEIEKIETIESVPRTMIENSDDVDDNTPELPSDASEKTLQ